MSEYPKFPEEDISESVVHKNLRFALSFVGFIPVPVVLFGWVANAFDRYMNTVGTFILLLVMSTVELAGFWFLNKIRTLGLLAAISIGQYVALYFLIYRNL